MDKSNIVIKHTGDYTPKYETEGSVGFDLKIDNIKKLYSGDQEISLSKTIARSLEGRGYFFLRPGERVLVGTGLSLDIPNGYQVEIRSRSGVALKKGLIVANSPGTIDSDYTGEIGVILLNTSKFLAKIELGERVAQAVVMEYTKAMFEKVEKIEKSTERGSKGFGSTGTLDSIKNTKDENTF